MFKNLFTGPVFLFVFIGILSTSGAPQMSAAINVSPSSGPPGTRVNVTASGFDPGAPAEVHWDSTVIANTHIDPNGNARVSFKVPGNASLGSHAIIFCDYCGQGPSASWQFVVTAPPPPPDQPTHTPRPTRVVPTITKTTTSTSTSTSTTTATFTSVPTNTLTVTPSDTPGEPIYLLAPTLGPTSIPRSRWFDFPPFELAPTKTPTPVSLDIEAYKYEVTQSIQCMENPSCPDNSIPLYLHKPTLIRVYAHILSGPWAVPDISGLLCNKLYMDPPAECIRPIQPIEVFQTSDPVKAFRGKLSATLNFLVPPEWISDAGTYSFSIYINPNHESALETKYWNNNFYPSLVFQPAKRMDVVFTRILNNGFLPDLDERWKIAAWLERVLPAGDIHVWSLPVRMSGSVETLNLRDTSGSGCGPWSTLLDALEWLRGDNWQKYYVMVDTRSDTPPGFRGCGRYDGANVAAGIVGTGDRTGAEIAAQELGHTAERHHAPSGGAGNPDPSYPVAGGLLDEYGVDVTLMQLYPPSTSYDFMGYAGNEATKWISAYTYKAFAAALSSASLPPRGELASLYTPARAASEFFVGSGSISSTAVRIDDGFYHLSLSTNTDDGLPAGPYTVTILDSSGKALFSRNFTPFEDSNTPGSDSGSFRLILPWSAEAHTIVFLHQSQEIGRVNASPHTPTVQLLFPIGNEHWAATGAQNIRWTGSDADGDPLRYILQFSLDDGTTWTTMAAGISVQSMTLDGTDFPGSNSAKIRVIASDGFNTAYSDSPAAFQVDAKPPLVYLSSPQDGTTILQGTPLLLTALGTDLQDGPLSSQAFKWSSNLDGSLGSGDQLVNTNLSVGSHVVTLTAMNKQGLTASTSVRVNVTTQPSNYPEFPFGLVIALVVVAGALAGLLILLLRRRGQ